MKEHNLRFAAIDDPATLTTKVGLYCTKCRIRHQEQVQMNIVGTHDELIELAKEQAVRTFMSKWTEDCEEAAKLWKIRIVHDS